MLNFLKLNKLFILFQKGNQQIGGIKNTKSCFVLVF